MDQIRAFPNVSSREADGLTDRSPTPHHIVVPVCRSGGQGRNAATRVHTLLLAGVTVHVVAARLGHADPAVTLQSTPTCCASTLLASGMSRQAVKASVSKSVSKPGQQK